MTGMRRWGTRTAAVARAGRIVLVVLLAAVLSGCLKLDATLTVGTDDTVSGDYVVAYKTNPKNPPTGRACAW